MELEDAIKLLSRRGNSGGLREHRQIAEWLKELKAIKSVEEGIIRNGKIYEVIKGNCSECAFDADGESLCRDFCETFENGVILDGKIYEAVEVDDITCKCCTGCAFEHDNGTCPNDFGKYIQWKNKVSIIFKKVEDDKC